LPADGRRQHTSARRCRPRRLHCPQRRLPDCRWQGGQQFHGGCLAGNPSCTVGLDAPGPVNLEKALRLNDVIGGHLVSGHVDGIGEVLRFDPIGDNRLLEIRAPEEIARYIARKGSIVVDGTSLTTNTVDGRNFTINLIPHTLEHTTLGRLHPGSKVNLEVDLIARYCERLLTHVNAA